MPTRYGNKILITVSKNTSVLKIDIDDDGPGIPDYEKKKVFKPFYRIDNSRNQNQAGTGLGLSIANELIKTLNGKNKSHGFKKTQWIVILYKITKINLNSLQRFRFFFCHFNTFFKTL